MGAVRSGASRLMFCLVVCALGSGCSAINALNVRTPTASFRSVRVWEISPSGVTANFDVDVHNPNRFELPVSAAQYRLSLGGVQVIDDSASPTGSVPADGTLAVTVPVHLQFEQLLLAEKQIVSSGGNVPFAFDGGLDFKVADLPLIKPVHVPVRFSGTLPLRDAVNAAIHDPANLADLIRNPVSRKFCELAGGRKLIGDLLDR